MKVDEKAFFREATLRICGSLEIEKALWQWLLYVRDFIPIDGMTLSTYAPVSGVSKIIAGATVKGGMSLSIETHQQPRIRTLIEEWYENPDKGLHVRIIESIREDEFLGPVAKTMEIPDTPALQMRLKLEGEMLGNLVVTNNGGQKYTQEHARLMTLINEPCAISLSNYLRYREVLRLKDLLADDNRYLQDELRRVSGEEIVGADFGLKGVMELVRQVAHLDSPVLLLGETGTGKEVIANAIHNSSPRASGPFIKVNCGAIPETLMDSELFGHEKGAFTGAISQKRGRFERAHGGTIFLDEIGELTSGAQVRLLRVLQDKEIERVGGVSPIKVDIRVIAATHRDLEDMLQQDRFRDDLYFRLRVFPIAIPPLRARTSDIPALVHYFIKKKSQEIGLVGIPRLAHGAIDSLMSYHWPGNVRELENAVERALILSKGERLTFPDLLNMVSREVRSESNLGFDEPLELDAVVSNHITRVLEMTGGKVHGELGAAQLLKVNPSTLRKRMRKLGIPFGRKWNKN